MGCGGGCCEELLCGIVFSEFVETGSFDGVSEFETAPKSSKDVQTRKLPTGLHSNFFNCSKVSAVISENCDPNLTSSDLLICKIV